VPAGCKIFFLGVAVERYLARIRNGRSVRVWTAKEEPIRGSSGTGTGEFDWPVDILAIHKVPFFSLIVLCVPPSLSP
jgi:hypothetical protein